MPVVSLQLLMEFGCLPLERFAAVKRDFHSAQHRRAVFLGEPFVSEVEILSDFVTLEIFLFEQVVLPDVEVFPLPCSP